LAYAIVVDCQLDYIREDLVILHLALEHWAQERNVKCLEFSEAGFKQGSREDWLGLWCEIIPTV